MVEGAGSVNYFYAVNSGYPEDHYAVMISKNGTDVADFEIVYEETPNGVEKAGQRYSLDTKGGEKADMSPWIERTVSLPEGTKYVAFRHYNCSDMNYIMLDDVTIKEGGSSINELQAQGIRVIAGKGMITINSEDAVNAQIINVAGQLVNAVSLTKSANVQVPAGVYVVRVGNAVQKVLVK